MTQVVEILWKSGTVSYIVITFYGIYCKSTNKESSLEYPDSKVHGANMGPIWGRQDPGGPHVGPMNFAIGMLCYTYNLLAGTILCMRPANKRQHYIVTHMLDAYIKWSLIHGIMDTFLRKFTEKHDLSMSHVYKNHLSYVLSQLWFHQYLVTVVFKRYMTRKPLKN